MKNPIKLDIEPGTEWLLPVAKRWLEQAKRAMRTPIGSKVFDLPTGEKVTINWRQGVDYVRIGGVSGVFGGNYETLGAPLGVPRVAWRGALKDIQVLESLPGAERSIVLYVTSGGKSAYGSVLGTYYRGVFWDEDGTPTDATSFELLDTIAPNGAVLPYRQSDVRRVSADGETALMQMSAVARLFPRAYLWSKDTGAHDLGFLGDINSSLLGYPSNNSNESYPVGMSDDGAIVFANHGAETFSDGGLDPVIGAVWKANTGWVRVPPPAGYVPKTPGLVESYVNIVTLRGGSADGSRLVGYVSRTAQFPGDSLPGRPVLWEEGVGTNILPTVSGYNPENTFPVGISRSGEFVLLVDQVASTVAVWSEGAGLVVTSLYGESPFNTTQYAVDDNGVAYGRIHTGGKAFVARCSLGGVTTIYETPTGATDSRAIGIGKKYVSGWYTDASGIIAPCLWDSNGKLVSTPDAPPGFQKGFSYIAHVPDSVSPVAWLIL